MRVTYQLTAEDYRQVIVSYRSRTVAHRIAHGIAFSISLVAMGGGLLIWILSDDLNFKVSFTPFALIGAFYFLVTKWAPYVAAQRQFRTSPSAQGIITLEASTEGLHFKYSTGESVQLWKGYVKWMEGQTVIALFSSAVVFQVIPKRAFTNEQLEKFKGLLNTNVSKNNKAIH